MSNMSYCRFENTRADVRDCLRATDPYENKYSISKGEVAHGIKMFTDILEWAQEQGIIESFDADALQNVFDEHARINGQDKY
jgi:hypothetical protein